MFDSVATRLTMSGDLDGSKEATPMIKSQQGLVLGAAVSVLLMLLLLLLLGYNNDRGV
jgi:hypothetical protein